MSGRHGAAQGSDHAPLVARRRLLNVSAERERCLADGGHVRCADVVPLLHARPSSLPSYR